MISFRPAVCLLAALSLAGCGAPDEPAQEPVTAAGTETPVASTSSTRIGGTTMHLELPDGEAEGIDSGIKSAAGRIQLGVTTERQVIGMLGLLKTDGTDASGRRTVTWSAKQKRATAKSRIPGAGAFIKGGVKEHTHRLVIVVDGAGVVQKADFYETIADGVAINPL